MRSSGGMRARGRRPETPRNATRVEARAATLPDALQFMRLLWAIVHGLQKRSKRMSSDLGVTGPQRLALRVIGLFPGVSAGTLASILHVHPSTLTGVLGRLADRGMLRRSAHVGDRRRSVLTLTTKGARVNAIRAGTVESAVIEALKAVPAPDRQSAQRVLSRLARSLDSGRER